ncbi:hypothetical protein ASC87_11600 [Rhizobacter sp. Root1221]|nr:hypothetical protein ASC87_11600 [Rhizobacter sp. Root1221]
MARQRQDPGLVDRMAVSTFEETPKYANFEKNRHNLEVQGVPILRSVDISKTAETAERLSELPPGANLHFQMPRVPRGTSGYSTQRLVRDTLRLPGAIGEDMSVSITTPRPDAYTKVKGTHDRIYGLESGKALEGTGMELEEGGSDSDSHLEKFGYDHKQSTKDESAGVADKRKKYKFVPGDSEHEESKRAPKGPGDRDDESGGGVSEV